MAWLLKASVIVLNYKRRGFRHVQPLIVRFL